MPKRFISPRLEPSITPLHVDTSTAVKLKQIARIYRPNIRLARFAILAAPQALLHLLPAPPVRAQLPLRLPLQLNAPLQRKQETDAREKRQILMENAGNMKDRDISTLIGDVLRWALFIPIAAVSSYLIATAIYLSYVAIIFALDWTQQFHWLLSVILFGIGLGLINRISALLQALLALPSTILVRNKAASLSILGIFTMISICIYTYISYEEFSIGQKNWFAIIIFFGIAISHLWQYLMFTLSGLSDEH